jgi:alpha-L-rhamnosidase
MRARNYSQTVEVSTAELMGRYEGRQTHFFHGTSKPYVRWWWLSGPFTHADITRHLEWVRDTGFGGVELAWLHPEWLEESEDDKRRPAWVSTEWSELVAFTKSQADALGLGCDFTFGSSWPFGGSWLRDEHAAQTFAGLSDQRLERSWENAIHGPTLVLNHLSSAALDWYARPLLAALHDALAGSASALFCDSLEVATKQMWSPELWDKFEERFGYSLRPFNQELDANSDVRYDYRKLIDETIRREFYEPFTRLCRDHQAYARVQCHGAPADLLQAYAAVDVPESESLLFPPAFSRIAASGAAWTGKPIVSAESFTCIYGFPGWDDSAEEYWKKENLPDLKLLADALFANGVNQIVWHGMPHQPSGKQVEFYASVHVGPDSPFAGELGKLNSYLENVSSLLKLGKPCGGLGIYFPFEDALMLDRLPEEQRTPGANYFWEMRHAVPPTETESFHPLWVSHAALLEATVENGVIRSKELSLQGLYVDCEWLDAESMRELARLAAEGATLTWKRPSRQPGYKKDPTYDSSVREILDRTNVFGSTAHLVPLVAGEDLPWYWARRVDQDLLIFFAHPQTKEIRYPMPYGFASSTEALNRQVGLRWNGREVPMDLHFEAYESLMLLVSAQGAVRKVDIRWE